MYYYYDNRNVLRGPYSRAAYEKWYEKYIPTGTLLYDENHRPSPIEFIVNNLLKSQSQGMFCDESFNLERTLDRTDLDVTIEMNTDTFADDNSTLSSDEFTQIENGVDEVDFGASSEANLRPSFLEQTSTMYIERRALHNRRQFPDSYIPFEHTWNSWVPEPLEKHEALRGTVHIRNRVQSMDEVVLSGYLRSLNIHPHPCQLCNVRFDNSQDMFLHFLSVIHIQRSYTRSRRFSFLDVYCARKIIEKVEASYENGDFHYLTKEIHLLKPQPSIFDNIDIPTAFESLKSTVTVLQYVPLLNPPPRGNAPVDTCDYIDTLLFLRLFEKSYYQTPFTVRSRRFGPTKKTHCNYCNMDFDATFLDSFTRHVLSAEHIKNALFFGVSRKEMEYWISFLKPLHTRNRKTIDNSDPDVMSLQERDFPLCYHPVRSIDGDFLYKGIDEIKKVLSYVREKISSSPEILDDYKHRTTCLWCHTELLTRNSVLRHILYDKCHLEHIRAVSNDDLRGLLRCFHIQITVPLYREANGSSSRSESPMDWDEKTGYIQRIKSFTIRNQTRGTFSAIMAKNFPFGLVNRCDLCHVNIGRVEEVALHFCNEEHTENLVSSRRNRDSIRSEGTHLDKHASNSQYRH